MPSKKLYLYFKNENNNTVVLTVDDPREDLTDLEVKMAMDTIVDANVLESKTGKITLGYAAKVVEQTVTELEV